MNRKIKIRSLLAGLLISVLFATVIGRVYWIQVVSASALMSEAKEVWESSRMLLPKRGTVYDRNGQVLAQDAAAYTVAVNPKLIHANGTADEVIELLAPILEMNDADSRNKLEQIVTAKNKKGDFYVHREIRKEGWKIDPDKARAIQSQAEDKKLTGIYLLEEKKRYYPVNQLASHLLGYTNLEGEAQAGVELYYDEILKGIPGQINYERDRLGYELPNGEVELIPPQNGQSIKLTIDEKIQLFMEQALENVYETYQPESVMAIAADPDTMEILAMANFPTFDPNRYWAIDGYEDLLNRSIYSLYEPGSTFKIVTLAAAVEENLFNPHDTYQSGTINVAGSLIKDHNYGRGWGEISYLSGLKKSSNVAFVKLGYEQLGAEKLRHYIDAFGFGTGTGIDLHGESKGNIGFRNWIATEVATATFGQGLVQVTPIQQIAAISAIANGGELKKPYLVKEVIDPATGKTVEKIEPQTVRRVVSEQAAKETSLYLEQVIADQEEGTGRLAYLDGYRMAGKTGTAQKVINGKYADGEYVVSFIGFAPVEDPEIALIVIADEPDLGGDYRNGSQVVSTAFKDIMAKSLRYLGVAEQGGEDADDSQNQSVSPAPNLIGMQTAVADNELSQAQIEVEWIGDGRTVLAQFPLEGTEMVPGQRMYGLTEDPAQIEIPDLTGKSLRDAVTISNMLNVELTFEGQGYVAKQQTSGAGPDRKLHVQLRTMRDRDASAEAAADSSGDDAETDNAAEQTLAPE
ncbi:penicillin-binding transpeptidase domain-containing protein [Marinicrinis sediminis]|uniref:Penicillin-binding transpeptidase domain-containing protein n=1 Tax=Marinicrinis sediminis TaxID=1652465 RepID=A0ABW5RC53_9BACL